VVEVVARGVPAGWGDPTMDKLDASIAAALLSIPALKGVEIGSGFAATRLRGSQSNDAMGPDGFLSKRALGESATQQIFEETPPTALARVAAADATTLAALLETEHPQMVSAILSQLPPDRAAHVLEQLPETSRGTILKRLGALTEVPAGLLEEVATALVGELPVEGESKAIAVDGVRRSAQLVRNLSKDVCESLLGEVEDDDEDLATEIRRAMYSFEDLKAVDPRSMRELLKSVASDRLTLALKTASPEMRDHIFSGMSKRAAERIKEDLELLGAVRLSEVEEAQREIVEVALRLEAEGVLSLGNDGEALV
jgi:flagellar motor switch protein FliG